MRWLTSDQRKSSFPLRTPPPSIAKSVLKSTRSLRRPGAWPGQSLHEDLTQFFPPSRSVSPCLAKTNSLAHSRLDADLRKEVPCEEQRIKWRLSVSAQRTLLCYTRTARFCKFAISRREYDRFQNRRMNRRRYLIKDPAMRVNEKIEGNRLFIEWRI